MVRYNPENCDEKGRFAEERRAPAHGERGRSPCRARRLRRAAGTATRLRPPSGPDVSGRRSSGALPASRRIGSRTGDLVVRLRSASHTRTPCRSGVDRDSPAGSMESATVAGPHLRLRSKPMRHLIVRIVCALVLAPLAFPAGQAIWYVDDDAPPGGDGTGWASAFDSIQDALDVVAVFDQVWVAAGNYVPEARLDPADPRSATFWVPPGTILLGGFAGRESSFAERAGLFERTVLSGHLGAPDLRTDDAYHVVYSRQTFGLPPQTEIDGFLIRGGYADGTSVNAEGGAIYTDNTA